MRITFNNEWEHVGSTRIGTSIHTYEYWISKEGVVYRHRSSSPDDIEEAPTYFTGAAKFKGTRLNQYLAVASNKLPDKYVHRMVAKAFVHNPNPEEFTVIDHIDGNKQNNHYTNLEWVTQSENMRRFHALRRAKGESWKGRGNSKNKKK